MRNPGLDEVEAGIKITGRNINNLRYADDTALAAESEELKSFLMKVKGQSEKADLKLNIQKTKIMISGPITLGQIKSATVSNVSPFICPKVMGPDIMILVFCILSYKPAFSLSSFHQEAL